MVAALVLTTGAHWAALQTVAWTTMIAANLSRQHSLTEAVSETFDGKHPCPLCQAIAAGKKSEKKSAAAASTLKREFPPVVQRAFLYPPLDFKMVPTANFFAASRSQKPPVPPPRGFPV